MKNVKKCGCCGEVKVFSEFSWKSKAKNLLSSECKLCHRKMRNEHYIKNTKKEISRATERKRELSLKLKEYKSNLCCVRCGFNHPATLQFHHTDPTIKDMAVSRIVAVGRSWDRILNEINKCVVLCANCHAIEHWKG